MFSWLGRCTSEKFVMDSDTAGWARERSSTDFSHPKRRWTGRKSTIEAIGDNGTEPTKRHSLSRPPPRQKPTRRESMTAKRNGTMGPKPDKVLTGNVCGDQMNYVLSDNELNLFRTAVCRKYATSGCSLGAKCFDSHSLAWPRRNPATFEYSDKTCPDIKYSTDFETGRMQLHSCCMAGRNCPYAHSKEESMYHSRFYKSIRCEQPGCRRPYCPFVHDASERRNRRHVGLSDAKRVPGKHSYQTLPPTSPHLIQSDASTNALVDELCAIINQNLRESGVTYRSYDGCIEFVAGPQ